jgi:hypothetical protein
MGKLNQGGSENARLRAMMALQLKQYEEETGVKLTEEHIERVLEKAEEYQKKDRDKNIIKNSMEADFSKGSVRNQPCPLCKEKLKKCKCGFLEEI